MDTPNNSACKNKISFSWDLHYACNYRCTYCWWHGKWQHLSELNRYLSVEEWKRYWGNIYNRYGSVHIEVLGGEPFIYPHFNELIIELSKMHTLGVTTNLSVDIKDFVKQVDSKRVKIMPTFHPMFSDFDTFLEKMILLDEKGFGNRVSYLAYPPQISMIDFYRNKFSRKNISLFVMTFWGNYNEIEYPQGYTDEEKSIIGGCLGDRLGEKFQLVPKKDFKGKLCHAGHNYAVIQANGTAIRCGGSGLNEVIGNFLDENFKLLDSPLSCNAEFCKCNEWVSLVGKDESRDEVKISKKQDNSDASVFLENKEKNVWETQEQRIILESKPVRLGIIVTDWCNLRCIMCPKERHGHDLTFPTAVLSKINELLPNLEKINWQGGEFLGFEHIKNFFSSLIGYPHILHEITTNGLLLDEEWITLLLRMNVAITFSIDSPVRETYEYIRRGAKYEELTDRLNLIQDLERRHKKKLNRAVIVVVMRSNYLHLHEFVRFVKMYGFESISFDPVKWEDEENIFRDPHCDYRLLNETMNLLKDEFSKDGVGFVWNLPSGPKGANVQKNTCAHQNSKELFCNLPWKSLWICADRNGDVVPDCWCKVPVGNISHGSLLEIWNNEKMRDYRQKIVAHDFSMCHQQCIGDYSSYRF